MSRETESPDRRRMVAANVGSFVSRVVGGAVATPVAVSGRSSLSLVHDRLRLDVAGMGVRGKYLIANLSEGVEVTCLCDGSLALIANTRRPQPHFAEPLAKFADGDATRGGVCQDDRLMPAREFFDGVWISIPDHRHALGKMLASAAGIDVYLEQPMSLTV